MQAAEAIPIREAVAVTARTAGRVEVPRIRAMVRRIREMAEAVHPGATAEVRIRQRTKIASNFRI